MWFAKAWTLFKGTTATGGAMAIPELGARVSQSGLAWCRSTYMNVTTLPMLCYL